VEEEEQEADEEEEGETEDADDGDDDDEEGRQAECIFEIVKGCYSLCRSRSLSVSLGAPSRSLFLSLSLSLSLSLCLSLCLALFLSLSLFLTQKSGLQRDGIRTLSYCSQADRTCGGLADNVLRRSDLCALCACRGDARCT
jgi:hypothetical protein